MFSSPWDSGLWEFQLCFPLAGPPEQGWNEVNRTLELLTWSGKAQSPGVLLGFFHQDLSQLWPECCDLILCTQASPTDQQV